MTTRVTGFPLGGKRVARVARLMGRGGSRRVRIMRSVLRVITMAALLFHVLVLDTVGAARQTRTLPLDATGVDGALARYFQGEAREIGRQAMTRLATMDAAGWPARREVLRRELLEMLGLWPLPERTDLRATVTGTLDGDGFVVEKLHFQSSPGLYVTANLYRPREITKPLPAVLYVCGHARVVSQGASCGNKTGYQHHGIWLARHGVIALLIDTLQLGEIEGDHHGTYRLGQWWWNSRGYTPAGVEAWNAMRALDYLESRPEVDATRLGMTGRSGGGSYTWTTAALDERVRAAAPVAGITDQENHVVEGVVEGHCDCMYFVNAHRWDFVLNAALFAPRPLLIVNTDADPIFPLDGVQRLHAGTRGVYAALGVADRLGLVIGPGGHEDTQDLQVPVFRWFARHLEAGDGVIRDAALKLIPPGDLRVFSRLPDDQRNTRAQEWFGPREGSWAPASESVEEWTRVLRERVFAGWPRESVEGAVGMTRLQRVRRGDWQHETWELVSQAEVPLRLHWLTRAEGTDAGAKGVLLRVVEADTPADWSQRNLEGWLAEAGEHASAVAFLEPRGIGEGRWSGDEARQIQIRRRFMLLGQTVDGMRVRDIARGVVAVRTLRNGAPGITLSASGLMAINTLAASLFVAPVERIAVQHRPGSWRAGPDYLNIARVLDWPRLVELVRARGVEVREE